MPARLKRSARDQNIVRLDCSALGRIDTAGAFVLVRELGLAVALLQGERTGRDDLHRLCNLVQPANGEED